jgi:hypothetical protein
MDTLYSFAFTKNGLTVSYKSYSVRTSTICVDLHNGDYVDSEGRNAHRVDDLSQEEIAYINSRIDYDKLSDDPQALGNKVCEIYHSMIV